MSAFAPASRPMRLELTQHVLAAAGQAQPRARRTSRNNAMDWSASAA